MSRLRIQLEGSLPCDPVLIFEAMGELFPEVLPLSEQEYINIVKENNIRSVPQWCEYHTDNDLRKQGYLLVPWVHFNKTGKQFFEEIHGKKKTEQEHVKFMKENDIIYSTRWEKFWKNNDLIKQGYLSNPWRSVNKTPKQFFKQIHGKLVNGRFYSNKKTEQEHVKFMKENNLISRKRWYDYWKDNNLKKQSYYSSPWKSFNKTHKQFFEEVHEKKRAKQKYVQFIIKNNIRNGNHWLNYWKNNNLKEQGYYSYPWQQFHISRKRFFEEIYGKSQEKPIKKIKVYKTEEEHISFIKENDLRCNHSWYDYWKNNNLKEQGYYSSPGVAFNKTPKQFFEEIHGKKKTEQEHVKFMKENDIRNSLQWPKYWQDNNLEGQGYYSNPWLVYKKSIKEFFLQVKR